MRKPPRRWPAFLLAALAVAGAIWLLSHNTEWEAGSREAYKMGMTAETNGNPLAARHHYRVALSRNPYDWQTHLQLAGVLHHWLNDQSAALKHYLYAQGYSSNPERDTELQSQVTILELMRDGEIENPIDATLDMFKAVERGAKHAFAQRLAPELADDFDAFWEAWKKRGPGHALYQNIIFLGNGVYDAAVEISYPDGVNMCMRFQCRRHDIWRLSLSFP